MGKFFRLLRMVYLIRRYRLDEFLVAKYDVFAFKLLGWLLFFVGAKHPDKSIATRVRLLFEELGPIWIKLGQLLSIKSDFLPVEVQDELKLLQDSVTPFDSAVAKATIEKELGVPVESLCCQFTEKPLATASIAQVYTAKLDKNAFLDLLNAAQDQANGLEQTRQQNQAEQSEQAQQPKTSPLLHTPNLTFAKLDDFDLASEQEVVIKILRPNVAQQVWYELALMRWLLGLLTRYYDKSDRLRAAEVVDELEFNFKVELDLSAEATNAEILRYNFLQSPILYIPKVLAYSSNIMISERIYGVSINDSERLQGVNLELLAQRGVEIFFTQLLEHNFFHADMHPGNIFLDITKPEDPGYIAVDFGIVGSLTEQDTKYLVGNLLAFFSQDYARIAELHINSGWIRGRINKFEFERKIRDTLSPMFGKPLHEIRFSQVLLKLFNVARAYNMVVQPQLVLLQKTLVYVEAMGRALYPELNLWETAKPFLESWYLQKFSVLGQGKKLAQNLPFVFDQLDRLPDDFYKLLDNQQLIIRQLQTNQQRLQSTVSILQVMLSFILLLLMSLIVLALLFLHWYGLLIAFVGIALVVFGWLFASIYLK